MEQETNHANDLTKEELEYENLRKEILEKKAKIQEMMGRGGNSIVLEYGSHSLKYGLSSQSEPRTMRMLVARRIQKGNDRLHVPVNISQTQVDDCKQPLLEMAARVETELVKSGTILRLKNSGGLAAGRGRVTV